MFEYYTINDSEQIRFYQLPKELVQNKKFKNLSDSAKILYSLLRDRVSLSVKNKWVDDFGHVYIIFTLVEIMEDLSCGDKKATRTMQELQKIGLVESIRRGQGKPNIIYVKNFATGLQNSSETPVNPQTRQNDESGSVKMTNQDPSKPRIRIRQNDDQSIRNPKDTDYTDNDVSQSQRQTENGDKKNDNDNDDDITANKSNKQTNTPKYTQVDYTEYERIIKNNIEYSHYATHEREDIEMVNGLVQIMLDVILTETPSTVKIGKEIKHRDIVKSVYLKLDSRHIDLIINRYKAQYHQITHKAAYLRTMLYTVFQELDAYYTNQVRADGVFPLF